MPLYIYISYILIRLSIRLSNYLSKFEFVFTYTACMHTFIHVDTYT